MKKSLTVLAILLGLVGIASAEPFSASVSASQVVQSVNLPTWTQNVTIVSDGADTCYFRLFTDLDTPAAATTASAPLPNGAVVSFTLMPPVSPTTGVGYPSGVRDSESYNAQGKRVRYYRSLSIICGAGDTATWRVYAK